MSRPEDVRRCVDQAIAEFGHIDILVPCAGSSPGGLLEDLTEEQWLSSLSLKFMGYVRTVRAVISRMRERGLAGARSGVVNLVLKQSQQGHSAAKSSRVSGARAVRKPEPQSGQGDPVLPDDMWYIK
jgi:NAD(P)-dependent dehydrogenase (short-subunit alcohol dehydrogenase family)